MFDHRLILLATPRQIGVLDWRPGQMHWLGEFANDTAGLAAFRQMVIRHAQLPVLLVVDTVDEDYRSEVLPHVQGRARAELLARKLKQVFRNARFTGAWRQARETAGRRDDRYLLAALPDADWLMPWLSVLHREQVPLAGITPLAVAYQHLLSKLRAQEPHVLLACRLNNSLRLSYYHNGLLRFSRLIGSDTPTQFPGNAADEIAKTQLYLTGQRILPREARLQVLLLDPSGQLDSAQAPLNADPAFRVQMIDMASLARALRIPDAYLAATPEVAPLAAIAGEALQLNLAPPELLQRHTEFRWRRGLHWVAGLIAAASLTLTASYWLHAQDLLSEAQRVEADAQRGGARHAAIVKNFPALATRPDQLGHT
ncbi:MAG: monoheme cytochrome SoxX, partial [Thiobacillus sp.]|nr:monoheme cytochrome SoxX [Thiobacillus sp.]